MEWDSFYRIMWTRGRDSFCNPITYQQLSEQKHFENELNFHKLGDGGLFRTKRKTKTKVSKASDRGRISHFIHRCNRK